MEPSDAQTLTMCKTCWTSYPARLLIHGRCLPCTQRIQQNQEIESQKTVTLPPKPEDFDIVRGDDFTPHPPARPQPPPLIPEHIGHEERSITETKKPRGKTRKREEPSESQDGSVGSKPNSPEPSGSPARFVETTNREKTGNEQDSQSAAPKESSKDAKPEKASAPNAKSADSMNETVKQVIGKKKEDTEGVRGSTAAKRGEN